MNPTLHVRILSPQKLILNIQAFAVSSKNSKGVFDILPQHANFITVIENELILVRLNKNTPKKDVLTFKYPIAVISVSDNNVNIYTYNISQQI